MVRLFSHPFRTAGSSLLPVSDGPMAPLSTAMSRMAGERGIQKSKSKHNLLNSLQISYPFR